MLRHIHVAIEFKPPSLTIYTIYGDSLQEDKVVDNDLHRKLGISWNISVCRRQERNTNI